MRIIVYGVGTIGKHLAERISKYYANTVEIAAFLDTNKSATMSGKPVAIIDECDKKLPVVIGIGSRKVVKEIYTFLETSGFANVYLYLRKDNPPYGGEGDFLFDECVKIENRDNDLIPHIELHAIDSCNLNCRGCAHFSPLYNMKDYDYRKRLADIEKISCLSKNILSFFILGGEPLLNPELTEYLIAARLSFHNADIEIVTNGILLLSCTEELLMIARDNRVIMAISVYEATNKILDRILARLQRFHVEYIVRPYDTKMMFNKPLALNKNSSLEKLCLSDGCVNVADGLIARCPTLMYINALNQSFGTAFPDKGIHLISDFKDVESFNISMSERVELCDYCVESKIPWSQCGKEPVLSDFVNI